MYSFKTYKKKGSIHEVDLGYRRVGKSLEADVSYLESYDWLGRTGSRRRREILEFILFWRLCLEPLTLRQNFIVDDTFGS